MSDAAQDRQARALEGVERNTHELVKIFSDLNNVFADLLAFIKEAYESKDEATKEMQDREERAVYEESARGVGIAIKGPINMDANTVVHTSEFNNPEHRPFKYKGPL